MSDGHKSHPICLPDIKEEGELAAFHSQKVTFVGLVPKQYEVMG